MPHPVPRPAHKGAPRSVAQPLIHSRIVAVAAALALLFVVSLTAGAVVAVRWFRARATPEAVATVEKPLETATSEIPDPLPMSAKADLRDQLRPAAPPLALPLMKASVPPSPREVTWRRDKHTDEELRLQLLRIPEVQLDDEPTRKTSASIQAKAHGKEVSEHYTLKVLDARPDLAGLPLRDEGDCQIDAERARTMMELSQKLRLAIVAVQNSQNRESYELVGRVLENPAPRFPEVSIPTVMQICCVENSPIRIIMVEHLEGIHRPSACAALAKIALFDLSPRVRAEALKALARRPTSESRVYWLKGLRYPLPAVADHAAEALVYLNDRAALPKLKALLDEPSPNAPEFNPDKGIYQVQELVRINQLRNCLMCHAPTTTKTELLRSRIPTPGLELPPPDYYDKSDGPFVRADVTYVRQDFSVMQPVEKAAPWPTMQRFEYVVRRRSMPFLEGEAAVKLSKAAETYPQRESVLAAIRELSAE